MAFASALKIANTHLSAVATVTSVSIMAFSGYMIYENQYVQNRAYGSRSIEYKPEVKEDSVSIDGLLDNIPDANGWITMDDLDEPVVQKNNTYFLNHDAMGGKNSNGAIFLDENVSLKTNRPYTLLVYGHNMKSGAMFGDLRKYKDYAYAARHRVFSFDTMYEDGKYAVFSVAVIHVEPGMSRYVDFRCLLADNREVRKKELEKLESLDEGGATVLDVNEEDQLLLLITCTGDDSERLVVSARRLRDDETEDSLHFRAN